MRHGHWRIFLPNWRRLPPTRWFRCGDDVLIAWPPARRDKLEPDGRAPKGQQAPGFLPAPPCQLRFTKQQTSKGLTRRSPALTVTVERFLRFHGNPPSRTAQQHPVRAVCHAPSKVLPGLHGSIGPLSAFATASSGPVGLWHQRHSSLRPKSAATSTGLSQCLSAFSADQAGFTEGPEMTEL